MLFSCLRTLAVYLALVGAVRLLGKRQIGQLEPAEFVVTMLIANLASVPIQDRDQPLASALVPVLTVLGAELSLSCLTMHSLGLRRLLCGRPVILIENGRILGDNLRKTRVTLDELTARLRKNQILSPAEVRYAILETSGELSVFPWQRPATAQEAGIPVASRSLPVTVIQDGVILEENLRSCGRDRKWLDKELRRRKAAVRDTLLLTVDAGGTVTWMGKEAP